MAKTRILIVEDEALVAEDLKMALTNINYDVIGHAVSAEEAVKKAVELKPDLILMDIVLKGQKSGIDASYDIKAKNDIPILFLTAYTDITLINKAKSTEPYAYLVKPFQERQLFAAIEMALYKSKMEQKLKASEAKYSGFFKTSQDPVFVTFKDGRLIDFNDAMPEFFGYQTREDLLKIRFPEHYENPDEWVNFTRTIEQQGFIKEFPLNLRKKDGGIINSLITSVVIKDKDGSVTGYQGTIRDITECKRAEEALKESEQQLRETRDYLDNVIASSADAIVVVDMDGIVREWNRGAELYMGYSADEVLGSLNKKFFADPKEADRIMELALSKGELKGYRTTVLNKYKRPVSISLSVAVLRDKNGVPVGTVRVSRDITKEVALEEEIRKERDNLNLIFESMADGVYIVSKDYRIEFMNKVLIDAVGDQVGKLCYEAFHNRKEPCPKCKHTEVQKRKNVRWEWHYCRGDKTYDLIETPLRNADGTVSKLTIFRDITKRKRAEDQIKASLREKEVMLREIHHRVKNNLQVISSILNMQSRAIKDETMRDILLESKNRIHSMALIYSQLYESENLSEINMRRFVDKLLLRSLHSYPITDTKISPIVHGDECTLPISIAIPVGLVVNELLTNAFKHAFVNKKEGKIEIALKASEEGGFCLSVSDDGVGLPESFDINATETIGLRMVRILVEEQLDGKLTVIQDIGKTTFKVEFSVAGGFIARQKSTP